mgnify:CR=1 FL=1
MMTSFLPCGKTINNRESCGKCSNILVSHNTSSTIVSHKFGSICSNFWLSVVRCLPIIIHTVIWLDQLHESKLRAIPSLLHQLPTRCVNVDFSHFIEFAYNNFVHSSIRYNTPLFANTCVVIPLVGRCMSIAPPL